MQISSRVRQRRSATERQEILSAYRRSKLSQREFARQAGIGFSTLRKWLSRARLRDGAGSRSRFVQLPKKNRIKVLYFDGSGTWVCAKRLGQGCFAWPKTTEPAALRILAEELTLLLSGIDLEKTRTRAWWRHAA